MISEPSKQELAAIDWAALESVRLRAESLGDKMTREAFDKLWVEGVAAAGGQRAVVINTLAMYGDIAWVLGLGG